TAEAVGKRLQKLAENVQVLVITHSPQVAAKGQDHLRVEKTATKGNKVSTSVQPLSADERRLEVARMLAGDTVTPEAEAAAAALLNGSEA
ncbi:MAG: DNA repair protein RecN, partial [Alphaproteobacteria bacterium]